MQYQVTVRYGGERHRYHLFSLRAPGLGEALRQAAEALPEEVERTGDLIEVRPTQDPEARDYLDEGGAGVPGEDASRAPVEPGPEPTSGEATLE